jgi:tetratricopeptide (TPR) repeat protein
MKNITFILILFLFFSACVSTKDNNKNDKESLLKPENESPVLPEINKKKDKIDNDAGNFEPPVVINKNVKTQNNETKKSVTDKKNTATEIKDNSSSGFKTKELPLKTLNAEENKTLYISIIDPGWTLAGVNTKGIITLIKKEDLDKNTLFQFKINRAGKVLVVFTRTDDTEKITYRQSYSITIAGKKSSVNENILSYPEKWESSSGDVFGGNKSEAINNYNDKNFERARELFLEILKKKPDNPEAYFYLGLIEKKFSNIDKAAEYFQKVISFKKQPYFIEAFIELLNIYKNAKRFNDALSLFYKLDYSIIKNTKKTEELNLSLCDIYFNMKNFSKAREEYKKFIDKYPASEMLPKALFYYAYSLESLEENPEFKNAYGIYKHILDEYPASEYYQLSKGRMIYLERHYFKIN